VTAYLTPEQVLFLHSRLIDETGGEHGLRDLGLLLSALGRPQASFEQVDLYPSLFLKAAALMDSMVRNHPFVDGNKRTAIGGVALFLRLNGYGLIALADELVRFTMACAQGGQSLEQIADWFQFHTEPRVSGR